MRPKQTEEEKRVINFTFQQAITILLSVRKKKKKKNEKEKRKEKSRVENLTGNLLCMK